MNKHRPFREHHTLELLEEYSRQQLPLDLFISNYFRDHKALGPKDRGEIAETVYGIIRWKGLIDHICNNAASWEKRFDTYRQGLQAYIENEEIPAHIRYSFPKELYDLIIKSHGEQQGSEICLCCNSPAPTTVRINPAKTTRQHMLEQWQAQYSIIPCQYSEHGITFNKKLNFFTLPEFKEGLFEVQDEGSQLLCEMVKPIPGQSVMDYCAGSGGKTLGFAYRMQGKGQIYLHDIRPHALEDARKRLKRAGIQNAQVINSDEEAKLKKLKKKMDWVIVDAPCSGTGTLRRNPDMKWKFSAEMMTRLVGQQRSIFEKALSFLAPEGRILYSTCSILREENEEQIAHFMKTYDLEIDGETFHSIPSKGGMDGFYGVLLRRKK